MNDIFGFLAVVVVGPLVGAEFAVARFFNPIVGRLPDAAFRAARSGSSALLGKVMPFWYIASLVLLVACTLVAHSPLIAIATGLMVVIVALTVLVLVPINNRIARWADDASAADESARQLAARWDRLHWLRVTLLAVLFVLLVVGSR
ncbi:MAG TPA: DUF1772 domain-containing protein [Mycobacterium sp.]|nr:DUF1772 domain-containing protein [Mycobacterium sp.]